MLFFFFFLQFSLLCWNLCHLRFYSSDIQSIVGLYFFNWISINSCFTLIEFQTLGMKDCSDNLMLWIMRSSSCNDSYLLWWNVRFGEAHFQTLCNWTEPQPMRGMAHFCSPSLLGHSSFFLQFNFFLKLGEQFLCDVAVASAAHQWGQSNYIAVPSLLSLPPSPPFLPSK